MLFPKIKKPLGGPWFVFVFLRLRDAEEMLCVFQWDKQIMIGQI